MELSHAHDVIATYRSRTDEAEQLRAETGCTVFRKRGGNGTFPLKSVKVDSLKRATRIFPKTVKVDSLKDGESGQTVKVDSLKRATRIFPKVDGALC